jgi:hypothetical protein
MYGFCGLVLGVKVPGDDTASVAGDDAASVAIERTIQALISG